MQSMIRCSKCKIKKYTNPRALDRRIKKFGSIEEIEKKWVCRNCTRLEKEINRDPLSDEEIDKKINKIKNNFWDHIKRGYYKIGDKEMFFRSKAEANYALYLNFLIKQKQIKAWEYEPVTFWFPQIKRGVVSYKPDFRVLTDENKIEYHEVKGHMDAKSKTKLKRMAKYHPDVKMVLIDKENYKDIKNKVGRLIGFY
jgi:hypothetical protein